MHRDRWHQIDEIFQGALDQPDARRSTWIDEQCADDAELLREVRALLAAHERADGILDRPVGSFLAPIPDPSAEHRQIGAYRVLREVGRGGMGVVYLAERSDGQFRRRVAIKILRGSPDAEELHRRFLGERQILASLDHPNIAQLLDGGVTSGQLPYLVMEYVDGLPLTEYSDRHRLSVEDRLRLFGGVCAAVQHAHRNLIIHRDLKPSNILVTADGQVKLLDFGIAKLLNPGLGMAELPETRTNVRVMTPEYASPEQVRGESLTTASDVYALGVILYELLAGHRPYRITSASPAEIAKLVCEQEPDRPSSKVMQRYAVPGPTGEEREITPASIGAARDTSAERLRRVLQGDLDAIVMMALRKEPSRRYGSAEALAEDLRRYLEGRPIHARKGNGRYRLGKLVRRHRVPAAAAAMVALSLTGGALAAGWQAGVAARERDRTQEALRESQEVTAFLLGLFEASDPGESQGSAVTARDLLRRGALHAEELAAEPAVQARVFRVLGSVHQSLGDYAAAQGFSRRAVALLVAQHGERHPDVVPAMVQLAEVERRLGEFASAQELLERAHAIQLQTLGGAHPSLAETLDGLARVAVHRGDLITAERHGRAALELRRGVLGTGDPRTLASLSLVGAVLRQRGDFAGAERALREVLRSRQVVDGSGAASDLVALADLLQHDPQRSEEAAAHYRQALRLERSAAQPDHAVQVAALNGLGTLHEKAGRLDSAEAALRAVVEERRRVYGDEHPWTSGARLHLAKLLRGTGRLDDAEAMYREVIAIDRRVLGADHPTVAGTLTALGGTLTDAGRYAEADSLLGEALSIREARLGREHYLVAITLLRRAQLGIRRGAFREAESMLLRAAEIAGRQSRTESGVMRDIHGAMADLYAAWGRPDQEAHFRRLAQTAAASADAGTATRQ